MKRVFSCLLLLFVLLDVPVAFASNENTIVHITETGDCYHRSGCGSLRSDIEVTLRYAVEHRYLPCLRCDPPTPDFPYELIPIESKAPRESGSMPGSSGSSSTSSSTSRHHHPSSSHKNYLPFAALSCGLVCSLVAVLISLRSRRKKKQLEKERRLAEEKQKAEEDELAHAAYLKEKAKYTALYGRRDPKDLCGMPPDSELGHLGLPSEIGCQEHWGKYTCYTAPGDQFIHFRCGCCGAENPVPWVFVRERPICLKCLPHPLPDISWFYRYLEILDIKRRYGIDQDRICFPKDPPE